MALLRLAGDTTSRSEALEFLGDDSGEDKVFGDGDIHAGVSEPRVSGGAGFAVVISTGILVNTGDSKL